MCHIFDSKFYQTKCLTWPCTSIYKTLRPPAAAAVLAPSMNWWYSLHTRPAGACPKAASPKSRLTSTLDLCAWQMTTWGLWVAEPRADISPVKHCTQLNFLFYSGNLSQQRIMPTTHTTMGIVETSLDGGQLSAAIVGTFHLSVADEYKPITGDVEGHQTCTSLESSYLGFQKHIHYNIAYATQSQYKSRW